MKSTSSFHALFCENTRPMRGNLNVMIISSVGGIIGADTCQAAGRAAAAGIRLRRCTRMGLSRMVGGGYDPVSAVTRSTSAYNASQNPRSPFDDTSNAVGWRSRGLARLV
jgi:hypothetical protein